MTPPALAARLKAGRGAAGSESRDPFSPISRIMLTRKHVLSCLFDRPPLWWAGEQVTTAEIRAGQGIFFVDIGQLECSQPHLGKALEHRCSFDGWSCSTAAGSAESLKCDPFEVRCFLALISVITDLQ